MGVGGGGASAPQVRALGGLRIAEPWRSSQLPPPTSVGRAGAGLTSRSLPAAALSRRTAPLGPMPNEVIDVSNLERLKKYRSFDRYRRRAEQEARDPHWWRTYREHFGEGSGAGRPELGGDPAALGLGGAPPASSPSLGEGACQRFRAHRWRFSPTRIFHTFRSPCFGTFPSLVIRVPPWIFLHLKPFPDQLPTAQFRVRTPLSAPTILFM